MNDAKVGIELLSLLLQLAWSDDHIDPREAEGLLRFGQHIGLDAAQTSALAAHLEGGRRLPPPDLGFLRQHRDDALRLARELIAVDGAVRPAEHDLVAELETLLAPPA